MPGPDTRWQGCQHVLCISFFNGGHSCRGSREKVVHAMAGVCATIPSAHHIFIMGCEAVVASEPAWDIPPEPRAEYRQGWTARTSLEGMRPPCRVHAPGLPRAASVCPGWC